MIPKSGRPAPQVSSWPGSSRPSTSCFFAKTWMPGTGPGMTNWKDHAPAKNGNLRSIPVARRDIARKPRALVEKAVNGDIGGRRAVAVGLLVGLIAAVEASHQPVAAVGGGLLALQQALHLAAPALFFLLP